MNVERYESSARWQTKAPLKRFQHGSQALLFAWLSLGCEDAPRATANMGSAGSGAWAADRAGAGATNAAGSRATAGTLAMPAGPQPAAAGSAAPLAPPLAAAGTGAAAGGNAPLPPEPGVVRPAGWQEASHSRGATPDYARVFAEDRVHRIDIQMSAASKQTMLDDLEMLLGDMTMMGGNPSPGPGQEGMPRNPLDLIGGEPIYIPVTIRYGDGVWTQVGMRLKGNSSLVSAWRSGVMKLGFRLDFDRYEDQHPETLDQRFFGFGKMTFSSGFRDASLIRDKLASEVLAGVGLVSARCAFYRIYVDTGAGPEYWGLYTMIEDPADQLVEAQFEDKSGNLYKPEGAGADFRMFDMAGFEKKSNEEAADYSDVMAAITALHAPRTDAQGWRDGLEAVFDVESFLGTLAFSRAIGHWDGYGVMAHNYYLYGDPSDAGRLVWISWDHNLSWQGGGGFGRATASVLMDEIDERWPLIRFLLDDSVYRAQYVEALRGALGGTYDKAQFDARATQLHRLITPYVIGGEGEVGEKAPYTFITDPNQFRNALTDPMRGLLVAAETLRNSVRMATEP